MESINNGRAIIIDSENELQIRIPTKKNWFIILFIGAWLGGWFLGECTVISILTGISGINAGPANFFLFFWLCGWSVGGFFAIKTFIWLIKGVEIIIVDKEKITLNKKGLLFNKPKIYDRNEIKNLRVSSNENDNSSNFWNTNRKNNLLATNEGIIRFDYGLKTIKFANGIDEIEGQFLLNKINDMIQ
jgi:hypothetical protein